MISWWCQYCKLNIRNDDVAHHVQLLRPYLNPSWEQLLQRLSSWLRTDNLWQLNIAIEKLPFEIVDLPSYNMVDLSIAFVCLPEAKPSFSHGFPMVFPLKPPFSYMVVHPFLSPQKSTIQWIFPTQRAPTSQGATTGLPDFFFDHKKPSDCSCSLRKILIKHQKEFKGELPYFFYISKICIDMSSMNVSWFKKLSQASCRSPGWDGPFHSEFLTPFPAQFSRHTDFQRPSEQKWGDWDA